jgi:predicted nucleotidyltransferase
MSAPVDLSRLRAAAHAAFSDRDEVQCAYAFGSRISGRPLPGSDLDIALVLTPGAVKADPLLPERLAGRLAEELEAGMEIDAREAGSLPLALQGRIVTEGVLIHEGDPAARVRFETDVRRLYFDFLPLIERDAREALLADG